MRRIFLPGSIKHERQIPVLLGGHHDHIIGFADDLERDKDLWVSLDITFRKDFLENFVRTNDSVTDWFDFSGFGTHIELEESPDHVVKSAVLKAVYATPKPGFPKGIVPVTDPNIHKPGAVTQNVDYIATAKMYLVDYINSKLEKTDDFVIGVDYVYVVWFSKVLKNWKVLMSTTLPDRMYYELTFNGDKDELYIDAYQKVDNTVVNV
jgi:hypothetical protein